MMGSNSAVLTGLYIVLGITPVAMGVFLPDNLYATLKQSCPKYEGCQVNNHNMQNSTGGLDNSSRSIDTTDTGECCLACSCDVDVCIRRGNCCPDVNQPSGGPNQAVSQPDLVCLSPSINIKKIRSKKKVNTTLLHDWRTSNATVGVYMVHSCPTHSSDSRCETPNVTILEENIPHTSFDKGVTYRNIYCAECNNATNLLPWKPYITCSDVNIMKSSQFLFPNSVEKVYRFATRSGSAGCGVDFQPPNNVSVSSDKCFVKNGGIVNTCSENDTVQTLKDACENINMPFMNYEEHGIVVYSNVFCHICRADNGLVNTHVCPVNIEVNLYTDNSYVQQLNANGRDTTKLMLPWKQTDMPPKHYTPDGHSCARSYVYDIYMKKCRRWYCPEGREMIGSDCIPIFADVEKASYSVQLKLRPDSLSRDKFETHNDTLFLVRQVLDEMFYAVSNVEKNIIVVAINVDKAYIFVSFLLKVIHSSSNLRPLFDATTYGNTVNIPSPNGSLTILPELSTAVKIELSTFQLSDIVVLDLLDYSALLNVYRAGILDIEMSFRYTSITKVMFCTLIKLERNEVYDYVDILNIRIPDVRLHIGEFSRSSVYDNVRICLSDYLRLAEQHLALWKAQNEYSPQAIISMVCNILSIVGLLLTIMTYIIFDELRSVPGKNNMMLAVHLLIAQCLYQFGMDQTETPDLCIVLGMFIHLFWLTAIFWMNACTLHMFRTFVTGQSYRSVKAFDPHVCCYSFYCYGVAISMVAVNIGVSMYRSDGKDIGYGGHVCYISNPVMVGWVFALPVGIIIILNMGFFFAVVYQISVSTMRRGGKHTDRANTVIYMKLSSLTGVTWIFGYLYLWTDFVPFEFIFIILNAGQGVLIFISFICTKRIFKLYFGLFRKYNRQFRNRRLCVCFCLSRKACDTETNVDINTAKISLTAGSSTKGQIPYITRIAMQQNYDSSFSRSKAATQNESSEIAKGYSNGSDIFKESMTIAKATVEAGKVLTEEHDSTILPENNHATHVGNGTGNTTSVASVNIHSAEVPNARFEN